MHSIWLFVLIPPWMTLYCHPLLQGNDHQLPERLDRSDLLAGSKRSHSLQRRNARPADEQAPSEPQPSGAQRSGPQSPSSQTPSPRATSPQAANIQTSNALTPNPHIPQDHQRSNPEGLSRQASSSHLSSSPTPGRLTSSTQYSTQYSRSEGPHVTELGPMLKVPLQYDDQETWTQPQSSGSPDPKVRQVPVGHKYNGQAPLIRPQGSRQAPAIYTPGQKYKPIQGVPYVTEDDTREVPREGNLNNMPPNQWRPYYE